MYKLSNSELQELRKNNYLADDGHPTTKAFIDAMLSPSRDLAELPTNLLEHGIDCPICGNRYKEASHYIVENRKWHFSNCLNFKFWFY